jgi:hypothetical protein
MQNDHSANKNSSETSTLAIVSLVVLTVFLIIIGAVYYFVNRKNKEAVVFPAGVNYIGDQASQDAPSPVPTVDLTKLGQSGKWLMAGGKTYAYTFMFPAELGIASFPNDASDKISWVTGIVSPENNVAFNVEPMVVAGQSYAGNPEEFVKNYWRNYNGFSGIKAIEPYQNEKGVKGYKALYTDKTGKVPVTYYFFNIPNDTGHMLQVINGMIPEDIFTKIVNSVDFEKAK